MTERHCLTFFQAIRISDKEILNLTCYVVKGVCAKCGSQVKLDKENVVLCPTKSFASDHKEPNRCDWKKFADVNTYTVDRTSQGTNSPPQGLENILTKYKFKHK